MELIETRIAGVAIIHTKTHQDSRGAFARLFCANELSSSLGSRQICQINHSVTRQIGCLRGLHFQTAPATETKIVRCIRGKIFDVAVDLRRGSPTFLQWEAVELQPENSMAFKIPEGCAHGFQNLEEDSEMLYLHTAFYTPSADSGVRYDDPAIGITWPLPPIGLSARDLSFNYLEKDFQGITL